MHNDSVNQEGNPLLRLVYSHNIGMPARVSNNVEREVDDTTLDSPTSTITQTPTPLAQEDEKVEAVKQASKSLEEKIMELVEEIRAVNRMMMVVMKTEST